MKASQVPWWGWVLLVLTALTLLDVLDGGLVPLITLGVIGWKLFGRQLSGGSAPTQGLPPGGAPPPPGGSAPTDRPVSGPAPPGWTGGPGGSPPMPTIDVPRYPGSSPASGPATSSRGWSGGTDPARSLLRLQLAQGGRDLEQALAAGDAGRARQLLEGMDRLLTAGRVDGGEEGALHGDVRTALSALSGRSGGVDRAALDRVVARCRGMGQTGHHE
ncbi:hypothetical protein [uncultured Ornithinimicrobium sp.]|uniref:hypothetical protein n=1 Tax=uncultured Ornithinimicrobium sp. TaxID=259307 RepID=UPI0025913C1C|nr:hypothetical protein [uncultured Ornithinimicrobium sp.]